MNRRNFVGQVVLASAVVSVSRPRLDAQTAAGLRIKFVGMMDPFIIWWLVVLAIGLAVLYRRKTQPIALTLLGIYVLIAVCVAAFTSRS